MNAVPPPMTGIYIPPRSDLGIDESIFIYGPKQSKTSESETETNDFVSCESNSSVETLKSYESYNNDEYVTEPSKEQEKPSFAFANTVKHIKTPRETVEKQNTYSKNAKVDKRDWNDFDFHEKRMAKQVELNKKKGKGTGQGKNKTVWNNVQRLNHQNKFVPKAVLTKIGRFPVNTARQNFSSQAAATSTARKVNTAKPMDDPQRALKNKGIIDSGCSRHMTGNKAYLVEYQDYNGGPVAFGGSKGTTTGKAEPAQEYCVLPLWSSYTSTVKSSEAKNGGEKLKKDTGSKSNEKPVDQEEQAFLEELKRIKRQEKEADDVVEALRKEFTQDTEDLLL
ncbi:hypothetical protein Tco_1013532 [Tanacetum coccineum]